MSNRNRKILKIAGLVLAGVLAFCLLTIGSFYLFIPSRFTNPKPDHYHFRLQYVFRGQAENFGAPRYQVDYIKDVCTGGLTESPIHFHDNIDQIVHLHWQGITGGDVLKFYGVNKVGGLDGYMGLKLDKLFQFPPTITTVPIHSQSLPKASGEDKYFVYTGDKDKFEKKDFDQFLNQTLEDFLDKDSILRLQREELEKEEKKSSYIPNPFASVNALAHEGEEHATVTEAEQHEIDVRKTELEKKAIEERNNIAKTSSLDSTVIKVATADKTEGDATTKTEEELKEINNLIGNIVIFVQPDEPTNEQVQARFNNLQPLGLSVCGG